MNQFEKEQRFSAVHAIVYLAHFYVGDDGYTSCLLYTSDAADE